MDPYGGKMSAETGLNRTTDERSQRDARLSTAIDESDVIRRHSGEVAWPTVLLCAGLVTIYVTTIVGWLAGSLPLWIACAITSALSYAFFTVHHDATHKAISGRNARWRWLDPALGTIAGIPLQFSYRGFTAQHLRHHAHTNDRSRDPDAFVIGTVWTLPLKWIAVVILRTLSSLPYCGPLEAKVTARFAPDVPEPSPRVELEMRRNRRAIQIGTGVLLTSIPVGLFAPVFFLWWLPGRIGTLPLMVFFSWLPHIPFDSTARFLNTRINTFRGSTWLLLHQDRHLIHHLYPSVPWYRYRAVFREVRPLLEAKGARIEGRDSNTHQPITLRVIT
jgi:fatty acid desaturase